MLSNLQLPSPHCLGVRVFQKVGRPCSKNVPDVTALIYYCQPTPIFTSTLSMNLYPIKTFIQSLFWTPNVPNPLLFDSFDLEIGFQVKLWKTSQMREQECFDGKQSGIFIFEYDSRYEYLLGFYWWFYWGISLFFSHQA